MSTTPTTDQPPGFDAGTPPPRPPWWRRKLVLIPASGLALIGRTMTFAPPKGGKERDIPLPESLALRLAAPIKACPPAAVTLPWKQGVRDDCPAWSDAVP